MKKIFITIFAALFAFLGLSATTINAEKSDNTDNLNIATLSNEWDYTTRTKSPNAPSNLPSNFNAKLGTVYHYDSTLTTIYNEVKSNDLKYTIDFKFTQGDTPYFMINGNQINEDENFDSFIMFNIATEVSAKAYVNVYNPDTSTPKKINISEFKLSEGIHFIGNIDIYQYENETDYHNQLWAEIQSYREDGTHDSSDKHTWVYDEEFVNEVDGFTVGGFTLELNLMEDLHSPVLDGKAELINNIDNPYTLQQIIDLADVRAIDEYYGDISDLIEVNGEDYLLNNKKVGEFDIEFSVENEYGLSSTFTLVMLNRDLTAPIIKGPGTSNLSYTKDLDMAEFLAKFTATDNYYENIKVELESSTFKKGIPGTYQIKLKATDPSNNVGTFVHTLKVIDDQKGIITDITEGIIEVNWKDTITHEMLLYGLTAHDDIDGDITESIKVYHNGIGKEIGKVYTVKYTLKDEAGNETLYERQYKRVLSDAPVFWISKNLLSISQNYKLTNDQLAFELARYENIDYASHEFLANEYEDNFNNPGNYNIRISINDSNGKVHIVERVVEVMSDEDTPKEKIGFFKTIWNAIKNIVNWIVNLVKSIWNFIVKIFNFLFGWMF